MPAQQSISFQFQDKRIIQSSFEVGGLEGGLGALRGLPVGGGGGGGGCRECFPEGGPGGGAGVGGATYVPISMLSMSHDNITVLK